MIDLLRTFLKTPSVGHRTTAAARRNGDARFVPSVTCLEDRLAPAAVVNFHIHNGELYFYGTEGKDSVTIIYIGAQGTGYQLQLYISPCLQNGDSCFWFPDKNQIFQKKAYFFGKGGDDSFNGDGLSDVTNPINPIKVEVYGMDGNDTLYGGPGADLIVGGNGNDKLDGRKDGDRLIGENGNDTLEGYDGDDRLFGAFDSYVGDLAGSDTYAAAMAMTSSTAAPAMISPTAATARTTCTARTATTVSTPAMTPHGT